MYNTDQPAADILAFAEHSIGYRPNDSLAAVCILSNNIPGPAARTDLADIPAAAPALAARILATGTTMLVLIAYTTEPSAAADAIRTVRDLTRLDGPTLFVTPEGWREDRDHPDDLHPLTDITNSPIYAAAVLAGRQTVADRDHLIPQAAPEPARRAVNNGLSHHLTALGSHTDQVTTWATTTPDDLDPDRIAYLSATLSDARTRDLVLIQACGADLCQIPDGPVGRVAADLLFGPDRPTEDAPRTIALLGILAAHATEPALSAHALALLAALAWWNCDGARAEVATARALDHRPNHPLACIVRCTLEAGVLPRWIATAP